MSTLNNWGDDGRDDGLGDALYEKLEDEAKEGAKGAAQKGGKAAAQGLDKLTDKIGPVKTAKDFVKRTKKKANKAMGKLVMKGIRKGVGFLATHPVLAVVLVLILLLLLSIMDSGSDPSSMSDLPYGMSEGMLDDDLLVTLMDECADYETSSLGDDTMITQEKEAIAERIYSVFHDFGGDEGFNNASLAGMLANLDCESGLDASAIEGIFSEYGILGSRKAQAILSIDNYTRNSLFPAYDQNGTSYNRDGYKTTDGHGEPVYYCGLGLAQWTGGEAKMLMTAANTLNTNWYDMSFQLGYMYSDSIYRPGFFSGWVADQYEGLTDDDYDDWYSAYTSGMTEEEIEELDDTVVQNAWKSDVKESWVQAAKESAVKFVHEYEGNYAKDEERKEAAAAWYEIIQEWGDSNVDSDFQNTIASFATELGMVAEWNETADDYYRCTNHTMFDNSSLATAAISYAWPTKEQSHNNGTALYKTVHDGIIPGDTIYKACDRAVGLAVLWSGTDDSYPYSGTGGSQLPYLLSSPKWELVGMASDLSMDDLMPGDVFILPGHTFIYVGPEAVSASYGSTAKSGSDSVSGSLGDRSAGCGSDAHDIVVNRGGQDWNGRGVYYVFRCIDPDNSTTHKNIGVGMSG